LYTELILNFYLKLMYNYFINFFIYSLYVVLGQIVGICAVFGQLIFRNNFNYKMFFNYIPFIIILGGSQILLTMQSVRYANEKNIISPLTMHLYTIFIGYFFIFLLNVIILKQTIVSFTDILGFILIIIGIYIGEKYK
jgi:hypothetical protein